MSLLSMFGPILGFYVLSAILGYIPYGDTGTKVISLQFVDAFILLVCIYYLFFNDTLGLQAKFFIIFLICALANAITRIVYKATRKDETGAISRWDMTATSIIFIVTSWAVYYSSNLNSIFRFTNTKSSVYFEKALNIAKFLTITITLYPFITMIPLLLGVPPYGWNKEYSLILLNNFNAANYMLPPDGTGVYQGHITDSFKYPNLPKAKWYFNALDPADPKNPYFIVDYASFTRTIIYLSEDLSTLNIVFGGTTTAQNWATDFDVMDYEWEITPGNFITVHRGFYTAYFTVRNILFSKLPSYIFPSVTKFYSSGHSLGGALATLCGLDIYLNFNSSDKFSTFKENNYFVVTGGSPQVGQKNFVNLFNKKIKNSIRIVIPVDPVPHLLDGQFYHVKGYMPISNKYFLVGIVPHQTQNYVDGVKNWTMGYTIFYTLMPFIVASSALILILFSVYVFEFYKRKKIKVLNSNADVNNKSFTVKNFFINN